MEAYITKSVLIRGSIKFLTYFNPITLILLTTLALFLAKHQKKRAKLAKYIDKIPGPIPMPIVGNQFEADIDHGEVLNRFILMTKLWGRKGIGRCWAGSRPVLFVSKANTIEPILSSSKHIDKSPEYNYLHPWLGTGLLTSFGSKWHSRRKILTPAFHFKILDDFIEVFHEQATIMVQKLQSEVGKGAFNAFPYVTHCTLDVICETAMGIKVNAQSCSDSDYVKAVYDIGSIVLNRQAKMWLQPECLFKLSSEYQRHKKCIETLHGVSNRVIRERKEEVAKRKMLNNNSPDQVNNNLADVDKFEIGAKKRLAFLDLLIEASKEGTVLSNEDIREEVDTFMFEGHDTTSAAISWCIFLFGSYPEVQKKLNEEMKMIFGDDKSRPATMKELSEMKYLECCIKEALRLFPSVPMMARQINEPVQIGEYTVPSGTTAMICTYMLHRDAEAWPNPEQFDPDRFLPENCIGRHPFSYIPFSAGPRNCIGQKFAILEEKVILSSVLRNYVIESVDRREDLTLMCELILRPKNGITIKLTERK